MGQLFHNKGIEGVLHAGDLCLPFVHIHVLLNTPSIQMVMAAHISAAPDLQITNRQQ